LAEPERSRLAAYVDRFNVRDFDAVRNMLADEVRLDLVAKLRLSGRSEVGNYFHNYSRIGDWLFVPGLVDGRPAAPCAQSWRFIGATDIFHSAGVGRRRTCQYPGFSFRALCDRGRGVACAWLIGAFAPAEMSIAAIVIGEG
jgi:hypothetical protein